MRTTSPDTRDRDRFSAYSANESFYNGDAAAQLTVLSTAKRDEVRAVFNYARDILNKHAAATIAGLRSCVIDHDAGALMPGEPRPRPTNASSLAQSLLDRALAHSNDTTTDFAACLQGTVLGDSAFYTSHGQELRFLE